MASPSYSANKSHRNTIFVVDAEILRHEVYPGHQHILRVQAEDCAKQAKPGQFAHLTVDRQRPMRRPISIMRASPDQGWVDFLYKVAGEGTRLLSQRKAGETISVMGPIGRPFTVKEKRPLLIGGGVGMPPMICLAEALRRQADVQPLVILGSEIPFPFDSKPSQLMLQGMPDGVIGGMPLLEDWGIASRLASLQGYPGCYEGYVTDLAKHWLEALSADQRAQVGVYACGPEPMLCAVVNLAREYQLPVQVSLEEFMACAVGGCAGCVVAVKAEQGVAMQRVCVDGPVFDGLRVY